MGAVGLVIVCLLRLLPGDEEVPYPLHVNWGSRLSRLLEGPVMQDLPERRHVGPNGSRANAQEQVIYGLLEVLGST